MRLSVISLCIVLLPGCATVLSPAVDGPVAIGQTAYVDGPLVTPLVLVEDSRCPVNAQCVWAGRVVVRVRIRGHDAPNSWSLERELELGKPQPVADGALTLAAVTPERQSPGTTNKRDYRFRFTFVGGY